jgi:hypothetical protein
MSYEVSTHHVQQYKDNVRQLSQQKGSRLRRTVRDDGSIVGTNVYFDRIGQTAAQRVLNRHSDTPLQNTPHSRRSAYMYDYDWADLVDWPDKLKTLYNPTNPYAVSAGYALGRSQDDEIIAALGGTAATGVDGSGSQALPAAQKVAVADHTYDSGSGDVGLTVGKLIHANKILQDSDVDEDQKRYCVCTSEQIADLLTTTEVTSSDYNTIKALVQGEINTFMGFEFIRTQRLLTSSGDRLIYCYTESAIGAGVPEDIMVDIGPRRDKRMATQVYAKMSCGAVRVEDEQVVEIACNI